MNQPLFKRITPAKPGGIDCVVQVPGGPTLPILIPWEQLQRHLKALRNSLEVRPMTDAEMRAGLVWMLEKRRKEGVKNGRGKSAN